MKTTKKDALANSFAKFKNQELENPNAVKGGREIIIVTGGTKNDRGQVEPDTHIAIGPED